MNFEIYCDESRPELFSSSSPSAYYLAIGSVWLPGEARQRIKEKLKSLLQEHQIHGEFKWNKVGKRNLNLYKDILSHFFSCNDLRFRVILVEHSLVDLVKFHQSDAELGFFKFYYQLLQHWILDFNTYRIFIDEKTTRKSDRLKTLRNVLNNSNISSEVNSIQSLPSTEVVLIQLADLLTGLVNAKFNKQTKSPLKAQLISHVESILKKQIAPTSKGEEKFNVFKIRLGGGW